MAKRSLLTVILILIATSSFGADLLFVQVDSQREADILVDEGIEPIARLADGFLVLAHRIAADRLMAGQLNATMVAAGVTKQELALDTRMDRTNVDRYQLVFERGDFRLFRVAPSDLIAGDYPTGLAPIRNDQLRITWDPPTQLKRRQATEMADLDSLISLISQDSLQSYTERLQAFYRRVAGTDSSTAARDWIAGKFANYGYDSVVFDTFVEYFNGTNNLCENVVAYKIGSRFPGQQVIVGAHRDAVPGSPGADDNGSGTAGVIEMARILTDVETDMTFIFCLFDAEEWGLYGSYHYANNAAVNGDSIVYMFNMDMIGYYENSNAATVYHGTDITFSQLFNDLADSLVGITGNLSGSSSGSDHYPFQQNGYDVTFIIEDIFSSVYHSSSDSTSYMDFDYMTRMVKAGLATVYTVSQTAGPLPGLAFDFPNGLPSIIPPGDTVTFEVAVSPVYDGSHVAGSGQLHYRIDGGVWQSTPMEVIGLDLYRAVLPVVACDSKVEYYVSADEATEGTYTSGSSSQPYEAVGADTQLVVFEDDFQTSQGWTVTGNASAGTWQRGVPVGGGDRGDPAADYDGSGACYLTGNTDGDSDVDGGTTFLLSPTIDLSTVADARISYARWYHNSFGGAPFSDSMLVWVSDNNGGSYTLVEVVGPSDQASGGWFTNSFWVSDLVTPTAQVRVRFEVGDLGSGSVVEAGVDAFAVEAFECDSDIFVITTDSLPDWTAGFAYNQQLEAVGGSGQHTWADKNGDLIGTGLSLSASGLVSGTPLNAGQVDFTAVVTDQADSSIEKAFSFQINPHLVMLTESLPDGEVDTAYNYILEASGGTGELVFSDVNGDLDGTGFSLASDGTISGTPTDTGTYQFTARVEDAVGTYDETLLQITVYSGYLCGDIDGDGAIANVQDLTYLVAYLFDDGAAPPVLAAADVYTDGTLNIQDLTYLVAYMFTGGPPPQC